jgi:hypothetical protein
MASAQTKTITFEDIVQGRDSTVRVTDDGLIYAVDLVMAVTGKNRNDAGQAIRRIDEDVFVSSLFSDRQLSGTHRTIGTPNCHVKNPNSYF